LYPIALIFWNMSSHKPGTGRLHDQRHLSIEAQDVPEWMKFAAPEDDSFAMHEK